MADNGAVLTKVITGKVRLSYCHLLEPWAGEEGKPKKYGVSIIIPKSDKATIKKVKAAIEAAREQGKNSKYGGKIPSNLKLPLRDGDDERPDDEAYAGAYFINCSSNTKPGIVDKNVHPILDPEEIYSGMYARVSINFYPFNESGNKGVAAGLNNVQKLADGEFLGGRVPAEEEFEAYDEDDDLLG